ncbi:unnamed protein product [Knipowitschia caucasica]|uniref:Uncharacterized protein n=1 Tax=Knipowitschia caucasica TaxID=637954 RepID=A0AAV2MBD6_KNICA
MQKRSEELFGRKSVICVVLAILQITKHTSAQSNTTISSNTTVPQSTYSSAPSPSPSGYHTMPSNTTSALGDPAQFWCGVPKSSEGLTFTFYGRAQNFTLSCPTGHVEDIPQALEGLCVVHLDLLLAGWVLKGTSLPDNGTKVVCQRSGYPAAPTAYLYVYDNGSGNSLLIGIAFGGFFGVITVFGLLYLYLTRSESFQKCFRGKDNTPDDLREIVDNIEIPSTSSPPTLNEKMRDL